MQNKVPEFLARGLLLLVNRAFSDRMESSGRKTLKIKELEHVLVNETSDIADV